MKAQLKLLRLKSFPILKQLQLEEALLRADTNNWCLINEGSPKAIVLGISGKPERLVDQKKLQQAPITLIRRFSGGGTVIVDEKTLFVTMIINQSVVDIPLFPRQILSWNGSLYKHPLRNTPFEVKENDYTFGNRKFGGNAQYILKNRWLHHSTLLWDYEPDTMDYLKMPQKMPTYRLNRDHKNFLSRMCEFIPSKKIFYQEFEEGLASYFSIKKSTLDEAAKTLKRPHRRSTSVITI